MQKKWIWPFELEDKLGEGGMGVVYRGRYVKNNKRVAVKLLPPDVAKDTTIFARFKRELDVLKTLRHPNIVYTFGGLCEDKQQFYAMELVEGGSLADLIEQRGRIPWEQVVEYAVQMCLGLAYAHERNIIHRDVKPGNFLIAKDGTLKLSDFGIALIETAPKITAANKTVGSYHYMAPEQIRGKPPMSAQTDLYAVGCVLFEMLTGRPPFSGSSTAEILHQHLKNPPPRVGTIATDCPAELDNLIAELLEKDPANRPQSAMDCAVRLKKVTPTVVVKEPLSRRKLTSAQKKPKTASDEVVAKPVASKRSNPWIAAVAGFVILVLAIWNVGLQSASKTADVAVEKWVEAFQSGELPVQVKAAEALAEIGTRRQEALDTLLTGLESDDPYVRRATAQALSDMGAPAKSAIPRLKKAQKTDPDSDVRFHAGEAVDALSSAEEESSYGFVIVVIVVLCCAGGGFVYFHRQKASETPH